MTKLRFDLFWFWILLSIPFLLVRCRDLPSPTPTQEAPSRITAVTTNRSTYPNDQIPQYEKFEVTFQVETAASNLQLPYDAAPPPGVEPGMGVTIDAQFTPDNWQTIYQQPAFYYQDFEVDQRSGEEWLYPTSAFSWKVRFAPDVPGEWQGKLTLEDAGGRFETDPFSFTVAPSNNPGFIQVSRSDPRYFEFDNGTYFPGLGINMELPGNLDQFPIMAANNIRLVRTYLPSQYAIWGAAWSPWRSVGAAQQGQETNARLRHNNSPISTTEADNTPLAVPGSELFLWLSHDETIFNDGQQWRHVPCAVIGWNTPAIPVERNTDYRLRVRFRLQNMAGPHVAGMPFGLTVKTAHWLWDRRDDTQRCTYPGTGDVLAAGYADENGRWQTTPDPEFAGWSILESTFNSGEADFLPRLWLAVENATFGDAFIDQVWIESVEADGTFGPNVVYKSWMANHLYFDQRGSFAFDQALRTAEANDIYFKLVVMEKGDYALNLFDDDGNLMQAQPVQGEERPFFGDGRNLTKIRWLQQAWWRYLQARWGYSTAIHSWELLNEGSPSSEAHYILADEFGKYMHTAFIPEGQEAAHPDTHLVTTSFWNGFPRQFWNDRETYPHIDYADVHFYARAGKVNQFANVITPADFYDAAAFSAKLSIALQERSPTMPVIRGEIGFLDEAIDLFAQNGTNGVWLHNLVWAGVNAGGMSELYWTGAPTGLHIVGETHDHRSTYRSFSNFMQDVPLNNGRYADAAPTSSTPDLRAWGQMDTTAERAHLWIQNARHTWGNIAQGQPIPAVDGQITIAGFSPGKPYTVTWWNTYQPDAVQQIIRSEQIIAESDGALRLEIRGLEGDTAVQIAP